MFSRHWKRIWQIIAGNIQNVTEYEVKKAIFRNKNLIFDGLLQFKDFKDKDSDAESSAKSDQESKKEPCKDCKDCAECPKHRYEKFLDRLTKYLVRFLQLHIIFH